MGTSAALLLVGLTSLVALDQLFFSQTVHWLAGEVEKRTAVTLSFRNIEGSLIRGMFKFEGLEVKKDEESIRKFDLRADSAEFEIQLLSLLSDTIVIEHLAATGVQGDFLQRSHRTVSGEEPLPTKKIQARKEFIVKELKIAAVELTLHYPGQNPVLLNLKKIEAKPFRSRYAIFDSFFRANVKGTLDGNSVSITSNTVENGRETFWKFENLPVDLIKLYAPFAHFTWFKSGVLHVDVQDRWKQGDKSEVDLDWQIQLEGVRIEAPDDTNRINKTMMQPLVNYFENRDEPLDYRFQLAMNENQFLHSASLDAAGLWKSVADRLVEAIAVRSGESKDTVSQKFRQGIESFKQFLDKKRQPENTVSD